MTLLSTKQGKSERERKRGGKREKEENEGKEKRDRKGVS